MLEKFKGVDLAGLGKVAEAIPKEVYERSAATVLTTFEKLTAPITETTAGFGRYLRQKFDNMVEVEKAIATYTIEKAIYRAQVRCEHDGRKIQAPSHPKSFIKAIEEASKETDPLLHEMWANLLASQLSDGTCHSHFVEILPHFGPVEAKLLISLLPKSDVGENGGGYIMYYPDSFTHWIRKANDESVPWTTSCDMLLEFRFADLLSPKPDKGSVAIFYRTPTGSAFLSAVSSPSS